MANLSVQISANQLTERDLECLRAVRNRLMSNQRASVRAIQEDMGYASPRPAAERIDRLIELGYLRRTPAGKLALGNMPMAGQDGQTVKVPVAPDGQIGPEGLSPDICYLTLPIEMRLARPPHQYFLIRACDTGLAPDGLAQGDLALVRQQASAQTGDLVAALVDGRLLLRRWTATSQAVILTASQPGHQAIVLAPTYRPQGVIVTMLPNLLEAC